ncbi:MAG: choice-of-anchor I family protein [Actinomycetes bacterium]
MRKHNILLSGVTAVAFLVGASAIGTGSHVSAQTENGAGFKYIGRWNSTSGIGGAEISAYDPASQRLFVTNGATNQIDIVNISNPSKPIKVSSIDLAAKGVTGVQSVAVKDGLVAVAATMAKAQYNGRIFFANIDGVLQANVADGVEVGALPDHVSFTPDGNYVLVAGEGEPSTYCTDATTLFDTQDPLGTVSIIDVSVPKPLATTLDFKSFAERAGAIVFQGGRIFGPKSTVAQDLEPEYIAASADSKYAYVTLQENNAIATVDLGSKKIIQISGLGYKSYNSDGKGLDAISDGTALIAKQNVMGMYQPDGIATLTANDTTYLITANEGDAREYPCLLGGTDGAKAEKEAQKISGVYDSTDSGITAVNTAVGSLEVTQFAPANAQVAKITSATKVKTAYTFGTRSFSVWKANNLEGVDTADLKWDSGDAIEKITSTVRPSYFNADWNTTSGFVNAVDARSTKKGPEPEGVAVGQAYGTNWIVVGLERDGGLLLYDATNPEAPVFVDYINTSNPSGNLLAGKYSSTAGDVSPEGIVFVSPEDSPTGKALVLASYELSGTVGIYEIPQKLPGTPRNVIARGGNGKIMVSYKPTKTIGWTGQLWYSAVCRSSKGTVKATSTRNSIVLDIPASKRGATYKCNMSAVSALGSGESVKALPVVVK